MKRFRSDRGSFRVRFRVVTGLALLFSVVPLVASIAPSVVTTDLFIVSEDEPIAEDVYVAATSGRVEGRIDGDLVITVGSLSISGTIAGDVLALSSGTVTIEAGGVVEGSVRAASPRVVVNGDVRQDLFFTGIAADIGATGTVGRDVIMFGGTLAIDGAVGRDVRGRLVTASVAGSVGRDIDLAVQRLSIDAGAAVGGDVLYRSSSEARIAPGAVDGQIIQLPAQSNFVYGVILAIANVLGILAFIVSGIILFWLFRSTGPAAVEAIERHTVRTFFIGVLALIAAPLLILLLAVTLVGLPLGALLLVMLVLALVFGPVPAVAAAGDVVLRRKGGIFGGFVLGAVVWRLGIWLIPFVGVVLYLAALIWGVGGWILGAWRVRAARPVDREALPPALIVDDEPIPEGWDYPLAPAKDQTPPRSPDSPSPAISPPEAAEGVETRTRPSGGPASPEAGVEDENRPGGGPTPTAPESPTDDSPEKPETDDWGLPRR